MKRWAALFCLGVMLSWLVCADLSAAQKNTVNKAVDNPAPDFTLKNINGDTFQFKAYRGKPVLLIFTTTWCTYCKEEIPELAKMYRDYKGRLEVVAVYINESPLKVQKFVKRYKIHYTVLVDPLGEVAQSYFVVGVPTRVLVSAEGKILCYRCRSFDEMLQQALKPSKK